MSVSESGRYPCPPVITVEERQAERAAEHARVIAEFATAGISEAHARHILAIYDATAYVPKYATRGPMVSKHSRQGYKDAMFAITSPILTQIAFRLGLTARYSPQGAMDYAVSALRSYVTACDNCMCD